MYTAPTCNHDPLSPQPYPMRLDRPSPLPAASFFCS